MLRAIRDVVRLLDGERVHVGSDQHAARLSLGRAVAQPHHPGLPNARPHRIAELPQPVRHERTGAVLLEAQFRMLVQVAPGGDESSAVNGGEGHTLELGHSLFTTHISHLGLRAMHTARPWRISVCANHVHLSRGTTAMRSRSIFTGSFSFVRPSSVASRATCVSTTIPSLFRNQVPSTTFAVFRPTPGSSTSCSMVSGTSPPWRSTTACAIPMIDFVLLRKKPVLWISCSSTRGSALTKSAAVLYFAKSVGVTMFTRASVDCAERMVATSSSSALRWCRAVVAPAYSRSRRAMILRTRTRCWAGVSRHLAGRRRGRTLVFVTIRLRRPGAGVRTRGTPRRPAC